MRDSYIYISRTLGAFIDIPNIRRLETKMSPNVTDKAHKKIWSSMKLDSMSFICSSFKIRFKNE